MPFSVASFYLGVVTSFDGMSHLGFGFSGPIRAPYVQQIDLLKRTRCSIISIDVPSGWSVDSGQLLEVFRSEPRSSWLP